MQGLLVPPLPPFAPLVPTPLLIIVGAKLFYLMSVKKFVAVNYYWYTSNVASYFNESNHFILCYMQWATITEIMI